MQNNSFPYNSHQLSPKLSKNNATKQKPKQNYENDLKNEEIVDTPHEDIDDSDMLVGTRPQTAQQFHSK